MKGLEFLKKAALAPNEAVIQKSAIARTSTAKARIPEDADIRIFKDGSAYPSATLVAEFNLQYVKKDVTPRGNGFDVFLSSDYPNTAAWPKEERIIFITAVDRGEGKVDLFGSTNYDKETGSPSDVLTQGAATFGKELLIYLKDTYGVEPGEEGYIDLLIARDNPFHTENGKYYIPKKVSRGEDKGKMTLEVRENLTLFPLVPASYATEELDAPAEAIADTEAAEEVAAKPKLHAKETSAATA